MQLTLFAYPREILVTGISRFLEEVSALGVTSIAVATVYHSAEIITPRRTGGGFFRGEDGKSKLPLDRRLFVDLAPSNSAFVRDTPEFFDELRHNARASGIRLIAWTVALHQADLARRFPELTPLSCAGDRMVHALCPAQPRVQRYLSDLVEALVATSWFDVVLLESASYVLFGSAQPHEIRGVRVDPFVQLLLSLCFCEACRGRGEERGVDTEGLQTWVADEIYRTWNNGLSVYRMNDAGDEASGILLAVEPLLSYVQMRIEVVSGLIGRAAGNARDRGAELWVCSPVWARPLWRAWYEGVDPGRLAAAADRFGLLSYHEDVGLVARELDYASSIMRPSQMLFLQTLRSEHNRTLSQLVAKVDMALEAGISEIGIYNYAIASKPTLGWIAEVARRVGDA